MNFEPHFVSEKISDNVRVFLSKDFGKNITTGLLEQRRVLPIDMQAKTKWLEKGYELAAKFLKSNSPYEQKIQIEIGLLGRDFRLALRQYKSLDIQKRGVEADYWKQFDKHYWESFRLRMVGLIEKYSEFEIMATYVEHLITLVAKFSPHLAEPYWEDFLQITDVNHPYFNHKGVRAVHERAKANLMALKNVDDSKPLEMTFTAIDGTKINLADLRGNVVLIDFWTVRCAPCIKEMPHMQAMYDKYRSQGFEVIGLVGDDDTAKEQVLKIIKKQSASWPQYLDKGKDAIVSIILYIISDHIQTCGY
jgi:thiol-disulfide isomerase/thioredoxin